MNIQGISPLITAPVLGQSATATQSAAKANSSSNTTSSSSSSSSSTSASSLESTFLNLLVTELKNQDPTSPVDATQMVSQMVSLEELDQLVSINQTLTNMKSGTSSTTSSTTETAQTQVAKSAASTDTANTTAAASTQAAANSAANYLVPAATAGTGSNSGLMNLYGNLGQAGTSPYLTNTGVR